YNNLVKQCDPHPAPPGPLTTDGFAGPSGGELASSSPGSCFCFCLSLNAIDHCRRFPHLPAYAGTPPAGDHLLSVICPSVRC
ncbi:hypothetical protein B0T17DRAFT_526115, partial [Bombardia bombarda]